MCHEGAQGDVPKLSLSIDSDITFLFKKIKETRECLVFITTLAVLWRAVLSVSQSADLAAFIQTGTPKKLLDVLPSSQDEL